MRTSRSGGRGTGGRGTVSTRSHHSTLGMRFPPEVLSHDEVVALMMACSTRSASGARTRAMIAVMYRAGLRISEVLDLRPKDIDLVNGTVRILRGKGGYARTVGIDAGAVTYVERWLAKRSELNVNGVHPLFCSSSGQRVTNAYMRRLFPQLAAKAGIEKRVHAHGLRHTHAAQLREEGIDIGIISKQLGHRSITTTAVYLDHIAPWAVVEVMRGRVW